MSKCWHWPRRKVLRITKNKLPSPQKPSLTIANINVKNLLFEDKDITETNRESRDIKLIQLFNSGKIYIGSLQKFTAYSDQLKRNQTMAIRILDIRTILIRNYLN